MTREHAQGLFDAERAVREAHDQLVNADATAVLPLLERATREALDLDQLDEDESSLRLVRVAALLGEMQGGRVVDLLVDILGLRRAGGAPRRRRGARRAGVGSLQGGRTGKSSVRWSDCPQAILPFRSCPTCWPRSGAGGDQAPRSISLAWRSRRRCAAVEALVETRRGGAAALGSARQ